MDTDETIISIDETETTNDETKTTAAVASKGFVVAISHEKYPRRAIKPGGPSKVVLGVMKKPAFIEAFHAEWNKTTQKDFKPVLRNVTYDSVTGCVLVECADEDTRDWFHKVVPKMGRNSIPPMKVITEPKPRHKKASANQNSTDETKSNAVPTKGPIVAISCEKYPKKHLKPVHASHIMGSLKKQALLQFNHEYSKTKPVLKDVTFDSVTGCVMVECADEKTRSWLYRFVPKMGRVKWCINVKVVFEPKAKKPQVPKAPKKPKVPKAPKKPKVPKGAAFTQVSTDILNDKDPQGCTDKICDDKDPQDSTDDICDDNFPLDCMDDILDDSNAQDSDDESEMVESEGFKDKPTFIGNLNQSVNYSDNSKRSINSSDNLNSSGNYRGSSNRAGNFSGNLNGGNRNTSESNSFRGSNSLGGKSNSYNEGNSFTRGTSDEKRFNNSDRNNSGSSSGGGNAVSGSDNPYNVGNFSSGRNYSTGEGRSNSSDGGNCNTSRNWNRSGNYGGNHSNTIGDGFNRSNPGNSSGSSSNSYNKGYGRRNYSSDGGTSIVSDGGNWNTSGNSDCNWNQSGNFSSGSTRYDDANSFGDQFGRSNRYYPGNSFGSSGNSHNEGNSFIRGNYSTGGGNWSDNRYDASSSRSVDGSNLFQRRTTFGQEASTGSRDSNQSHSSGYSDRNKFTESYNRFKLLLKTRGLDSK